MNQIINDVAKGMGELGKETLEKSAEETGRIFESVITGKELLGDIQPMSELEIAQKNAEDEKKKQEEMAKLRAEMGSGRNVEDEMKQVRMEAEREEEQEKRVAEQQERQRQEQIMAAEAEEGYLMESSNPSKQKKSRGSAGAHKKKQEPDPSSMSQTTEFKGKID